jgi:hypothetical protein
MEYRLPEDLHKIYPPELLRRPANLTVACYTFPHWHANPYNDRLYGPGWTEYIQMRGCRPWFPGHHQPRTPLLGELDERLPATWERYNDLAAAGGIDVFIHDWYWFAGGPVFHEALEEGYLQAANKDKVRFAVMFTNHDWAIWYPTAGTFPADPALRAWETSGLGGYEMGDPAPLTKDELWRSIGYIMTRYFHLPQYWRIDDEPFLPIWDVSRLVRQFGLDGARGFLGELNEFARKLGHKGVHFHAVCQDPAVIPLLGSLAEAGVQSYSFYNSIANATAERPDEEELMDYGILAGDLAARLWARDAAISSLPFFPNLNPGCDNAPRVLERPRPDRPSRAIWPGTPIVVNETPAAFEALVRAALAFINQQQPRHPVLTIGCWNEWTEGHYLLPDTRHGFGMLRALARALEADR